MKPSRTLLTLGTLAFTFGLGTAAKAEDEIALSFDLKPVNDSQQADEAIASLPAPEETASTSQEVVQLADPANAPLPVPAAAVNPPLSRDGGVPGGSHGGVDALALGTAQSIQALLPAPPPAPAPLVAAVAPPVEAPAEPLGIDVEESVDNFLLGFGLTPSKQEDTTPAIAESVSKPDTAEVISKPDLMAEIFSGDTESLVARAVGSAEGTRTPEGHKTPAYFGHVDPGNRVWNMGTFSYQHGAQTPEEADAKQLARLKKQSLVIKQKADDHGLILSKEELLNAIDLANQAPLAALDRGGYVDWLAEAHRLGMQGSDAIIWARTRSFIDPDTQRWNAPGLGNNIHFIRNDQERRATMITRAIQSNSVQPKELVLANGSEPATPQADASSEQNDTPDTAEREKADIALRLDAFVQTDADTIKDAPRRSRNLARISQSEPDAAPALQPTPAAVSSPDRDDWNQLLEQRDDSSTPAKVSNLIQSSDSADLNLDAKANPAEAGAESTADQQAASSEANLERPSPAIADNADLDENSQRAETTAEPESPIEPTLQEKPSRPGVADMLSRALEPFAEPKVFAPASPQPQEQKPFKTTPDRPTENRLELQDTSADTETIEFGDDSPSIREEE